VRVVPETIATAYPHAASSCNPDGSVELYRTGGTGPFTYSLDDATYQASNVFSGKAAGQYTGWVKDLYGCKSSVAFEIAAGTGLTLTYGKSNPGACTNDGTFQLTAIGGVAPFTYSKNDITYQASNVFTGLAPNTYTAWVKDAKGCKGSVNITLSVVPLLLNPTVVNASNCTNADGSIQLFKTGGTAPYTYSLDGDNYQSDNLFTGLAAGYYTGYVKDSRTCVGTSVDILVGPESCQQRVAGTKARTAASKANEAMEIQAFPNPTATEFTLSLKGNTTDKVNITVTDILGKKIYEVSGTGKNQYRFGATFQPGVYLVQLIQGNNKKTIKVIKQ
jgi:hypothetical protein